MLLQNDVTVIFDMPSVVNGVDFDKPGDVTQSAIQMLCMEVG
jgi:hypothetical protein